VADFKTALDALAKGDLTLESLTKQLEMLLKQTPQFATRILDQLDEAYEQKKLDDQQYASLKRQVNQFRRIHAEQTESGEDGGGDSTVFAQEDNVPPPAPAEEAGDATQVLEQEESTIVTDTTGGSTTSDVDFDLSMPSADTSTPSVTSATGPAGTEWGDPAQAAAGPTGVMGPGSVIKQRFRLLEVLGVGGMGKVYKGIDLLKEEAKDKNPYCAIKLLNEDFKDHPESFISLQRESSRQQKLAHPNIATIYDFDRIGGPGTPVYITMEYMDGKPLNDFIKKDVRKKGGIPFEEAYPYIKGMGAALIYAHERRIVHSDFKPGNAFLLKSGEVKVLDFGIARAVKNPVTGEAEKTLFDPGKLGALTPAYASLEMLEGEEPDTRDDTYALGCTCYELLTGKHPFNKLPANKAKENNLLPPIVKGLNKKQNRALRRSVAFNREDRSPTVEHFLEELEGKATWHKHPLFIAACVLLVIAAIGFVPAKNYLHQKDIEQIIADINSGDQQVIIAKLEEMKGMDKSDKVTITDAASDPIQNYYSNKLSDLIDISGDTYNFPAANGVLEEIGDLFPDSIFLQEQNDLFNFNKRTKISELNTQYIAALKDPDLLDNTKDILATIKRIDPVHPLLEDPRPSNAYRLAAVDAFELSDFETALALVSSGLETAPKDQRLQDLKGKIDQAIEVARLEELLGAVQGQFASLPDFKQHQDEIVKLSELKPDSYLVYSFATELRPIVDNELATILSTGNRADAETMATEYGTLLNALQLNRELSQIKLAHLSGAERTQAIQDIVNKDSADIEQALSTPKVGDSQWESNMLANIQELDSLSSEDITITSKLDGFRQKVADLYINEANATLKAERFDAADGLIDKGERFAPGQTALLDTRNSIAQAREAFERKGRIDGWKEDFKTYTDADNVVDARATFEELKGELGEDDPYIMTEAPVILSKSYLRLAQRKGEAKEYQSALAFARAGREFDSNNVDLKRFETEYESEVNIIDLTQLFKTKLVFPNDTRLKIDQIETYSATRSAEFRKTAVETLAGRINALQTSNPDAAATLAQNAGEVFPTSSVLAKLKEELKPKPWEQAVAANAALAAGKLSEATRIQQAAASEFAGRSEFVKFSENLDQKVQEANGVFELYLKDKDAAGNDYEQLRKTKNILARAQSLWTDSVDFDNAAKDLDQLIADNKPKPKPKIRKKEKELDIAAVEPAKPGTAAAEKAEWKPITSDQDCTTRLAGYGKRAKAICFDMIHASARGPLMVVVPTGEGFQNGFAISKYEISVGDWSKYCILSGKCKPIKDQEKKNDPMTGITLQQAKDYTKWLSERTGKTYRLPSTPEWEYAANAGGKQPKKDYNCRVAIGEKVIKGTGTVSIKSGKSNGWGLKNYVGNVQEWVIDGDTTTVRGGAYTDAHSKCDISLERPHNGSADESTGFRLLREEVG
jgi:serine/threonine protein kinase